MYAVYCWGIGKTRYNASQPRLIWTLEKHFTNPDPTSTLSTFGALWTELSGCIFQYPKVIYTAYCSGFVKNLLHCIAAGSELNSGDAFMNTRGFIYAAYCRSLVKSRSTRLTTCHDSGHIVTHKKCAQGLTIPLTSNPPPKLNHGGGLLASSWDITIVKMQTPHMPALCRPHLH